MREHPLPVLDPHDLPVPVRPAAAATNWSPSCCRTCGRCCRPRRGTAGCDAGPGPRHAPTAALAVAGAARALPHGLDLLAAFAEREGHACPPSEHQENGFPLGRWVTAQRRLYRAGKLPQAQADLLTGLHGWVWDGHAGRRAERWSEFQAALRGFIARHGHADVTHRHVEGAYPLGRQVTAMRAAYRRGALAADRVEALEQIPGWAWSRG